MQCPKCDTRMQKMDGWKTTGDKIIERWVSHWCLHCGTEVKMPPKVEFPNLSTLEGMVCKVLADGLDGSNG